MYQRRKARILLVVLVLVAFVLVTVDFRSGDDEGSDGPLDRLRGAATALVRPIQDGVATVVRPVADSLGGVTDVFSVRSENERLRAQIETLQVRERSTVDLERENAELRQLLELRERAELEAVTASVVALGASQFEWTITLNVGSDAGVARNMPVINGDGLVGRVLDTTASASTVLLTIDPNFSVTVRGSGDGEIGLLAGRGGEPLSFSPLDPEVEFVENQELVTTSYDGGLYPAGIPVGTIAEPGESTTALAREIPVRPFVDFTRLHEVLVIINAPTEPLPPFEDSEALDFIRPDVETFVDPDGGGSGADVEGEGSGAEDGGDT